MAKITKVVARQVFDSRGLPQLRLKFFVEIFLPKQYVHLVHQLELTKHMKKETKTTKNI